MGCSPFRIKFGTVALIVQIVFVVLFGLLVEYDAGADPKLEDASETGVLIASKYPPFQDVHVMIFIGFGFLMTFLSKFGYSSVGFNFFLASLLIQWAMIVRGFVNQGLFLGEKFSVEITEMISADFAAATVLISFGAVLGRTSPLQLLIMGMVEVVMAQINAWVCHHELHAVDIGESMYIHAFGAYFGLAVSRVLYSKNVPDSHKAESVYHSDLFSMIGTVFLWLYWPSFNGGGAYGDEQHRAFINTYLSLCACTVVTFAMSALYDKKGKFTMEFIQNATLAGGVAVGTTANMPLQPFGALIMGGLAGLISVTGYKYISGFLADKLRIQDTCGVHNLHGMPALLAAIAGAVMAAISTEEKWGRSLYEIFPMMVPSNLTDFKYTDLATEPGKGWSSGKQGGYQILALVITLAFAIVSGILTGLLMKIPVLDQFSDTEDLFEDEQFWNLPEEEHDGKGEKYEENNGGALQDLKKGMDNGDDSKGTAHL